MTEVHDDGWSFRHDRARDLHRHRGARSRPSTWRRRTRELSTPGEGRSPRSSSCSAAHARPASTPCAAACHRIGPDGATAPDLTSYDEWREALVDGPRLPLDDVPDDELRALWDRTRPPTARGWPRAGRDHDLAAAPRPRTPRSRCAISSGRPTWSRWPTCSRRSSTSTPTPACWPAGARPWRTRRASTWPRDLRGRSRSRRTTPRRCVTWRSSRPVGHRARRAGVERAVRRSRWRVAAA